MAFQLQKGRQSVASVDSRGQMRTGGELSVVFSLSSSLTALLPAASSAELRLGEE